MKIKAMPGKVIISDIQRGERMHGQILLLNDDGRAEGVRPRWGQIYAVGEDIKDVKVGEWILIKHGNWTRGIALEDDDGEPFTIWGVNWPTGVIAAAEEPTEATWSSGEAVSVQQLTR